MPPILEGIIPPLITPLLDSGGIDEHGLARLVERVVGGGPRFLFLLGTTGEAPSLAMGTKLLLPRLVSGLAGQRARILVNVTSTSVEETFALADCAAQAGAIALVLAPPFYFSLTEDELTGYFERVIPKLPLPVYLYNYPLVFKSQVGLAMLGRLRGLPGLLGLKDSSGDLEYFAAARRQFPKGSGFGLYCGPEELLAEALALGADGGVSGGANLFPSLYVGLYQAFLRGDAATVAILRESILEVSRSLYGVAGGYAGSIRGIKCGLEALGVCRATTAEPLGPMPVELSERIAQSAKHLDAKLK
jgi:4-hydroxy-tetrahydrodipicolinate synthase